jgi:hypothetical protein
MRTFLVIILAIFCVMLFAPGKAQLANAPVLLTKTNSTRGIAVESTGLTAEPFGASASIPLSVDNRTRVMLFASNLTLFTRESAANVTASAEGRQSHSVPTGGRVRRQCSESFGVMSVIVRLNDNLGDVGDVLV